jgi:hypothetical protein
MEFPKPWRIRPAPLSDWRVYDAADRLLFVITADHPDDPDDADAVTALGTDDTTDSALLAELQRLFER